MKKSFKGFTLAEMMVVMLVLTILLAAAAPIMTKRKSGGASDQPWKYSINNTDAYFGLANNQTAMIGQDEKTDKDLSARLILTGNSDNPYITFKSAANNTVANMFFKGSNFIIGGPYDTDNAFEMTGSSNVAIGQNALKQNPNGSYNIAIGDGALEVNTPPASISVGNETVPNTYNIAIGHNALKNNAAVNSTNSLRNIAIGTNALSSGTKSNSIAIGHDALTKGGRISIALGSYALENSTNGEKNIAIGQASLHATETAGSNIAIGYAALNAYEKNYTGIYGSTGENTAIGTNAMLRSTKGVRNTVIGAEAGKKLDDSNDVIIGYGALPESIGGSNVVIGGDAMEESTNSSNNIAIGYRAMNKLNGSHNVGIGHQALYNIESGDRVVAIGYQSGSGYYLGGSGNQHLYLGSPAVHNNKATKGIIEAHHEGTDKYIILNGDVMVTGHLLVNQNVYADNYFSDAGVGAETRNNAFRTYKVDLPSDSYGMPTTSSAYKWRGNTYNSAYPASSDKRLKNIKGENKAGLEEVRKLNIFDFTFKKDDKKTPRVGVIAQDLRKIFPNAVVEGEDGYLQIRHEDMFYAVINAIKQLDKVIEALIAEVKVDLAKILKHDEDIAKLQKQNKEIVKQNKELRNKNEELEKRIDKLEKRLEKVLDKLDKLDKSQED